MLRIAINGYGRIGRTIMRAMFERGLENQIHIEVINDTGDFQTLAHLTRFDSTFGRFPGHISLHDDILQKRYHSPYPLRRYAHRRQWQILLDNIPAKQHS